MDDKENKILLKLKDIIKINKKFNINKRIYLSSYINILSFIFIFVFLIFIIIILLKENKNLKIIDNNIDENILKNIKKQIGRNYTIIKRLFNYKEDNLENITKNQIHIAFSLDNKLVYPTFVSMASGLENNDQNKNIIIYHLLLSYNFNKSNIEIFESLKEKYDVRINYFIIPNLFSFTKTWTSGTNCIYFKVLLPLMFPDLKRIIHLDGDTLIRKDLYEMYNYPFNDNYILGFPFYMPDVMDKFGMNATHYITVGCILYNIEKIYNDKKDVDLLKFTIKNNSQLYFPEQDAINYIFFPNVGFLPLKYGIYMIASNAFRSIISRTRSPVNLTEGYEAVHDPSVIHFSCCWPKVWTNGTKNLFRDKDICLRYQKEFYYYANKTKYSSIIYDSLFYNKKKTI